MIWFYNSIRISIIKKNNQLNKIIENSLKNDVFYFFWGKEACEIIPISKKIVGKTYVRMHGYDLYKERNNGYIPYRQQLLNAIDKVLLISQNGVEYLKNNYSIDEKKLILNRIGINESKLSKKSNDKTLRIFSCSSVIPLKRVDLIARALMRLNLPVVWTHIGDGPKMEELKEIVKEKPNLMEVFLTGWVDPNKVISFYEDKPADLFINASTTEGVPVSIMEAISTGMPVIATDVGGTSEIVSEKLGFLLSKDLSPEDLSLAIKKFYNLSVDQKELLRKEAVRMYNKEYASKKNLTDFVNILKD